MNRIKMRLFQTSDYSAFRTWTIVLGCLLGLALIFIIALIIFIIVYVGQRLLCKAYDMLGQNTEIYLSRIFKHKLLSLILFYRPLSLWLQNATMLYATHTVTQHESLFVRLTVQHAQQRARAGVPVTTTAVEHLEAGRGSPAAQRPLPLES